MIIFNRQIRIFILVLLSIFFGLHISYGQISKNYIYAKVLTKDNTSFEGLVKFNKRTFLWSDFLKLDKLENSYSEYIPKNELVVYNRLADMGDEKDVIINKDLRYLSEHSLDIRFGFIKAIDFIKRNHVMMEIKDEKFIELSYNAFYSSFDMEMIDKEFGKVDIDGSMIERIEFMKTPADMNISRPKPIFGTVKTKQGEFTGFICWDMDEFLENDLIDGNWEHKEVSIAFKSISSIKRFNEGSIVKTLSGRDLYLTHSNDVSYGNRGLEVNMPNVGKVKVAWKDFESLTLNHSTDKEGLAYDDYITAKRLSGTVHLKDSTVCKGVIVYDLDEAMNVENVNGNNSNLNFTIPFLYVKSIAPKGLKYSKVKLKNGTVLFLGGHRDVNHKNDGVLVFTENGKSRFFHWFEIENIQFD
ncbi:MAG: hypothetical protein WBG43_04590 [Marinifilaceae bacterium]